MTNTARGTKLAARHIILGVFAVILSLGLTASVTFAGMPTSQIAELPHQGTDQPTRRLADSGGNKALPVGPADCTVTGSITTSDPLHYPVLDTDEVPDTCAGANPCPGEFLDETNYDVYTFNNTAGSAQCVTVTVDATGCGGEIPIFSSAYLNNFDPSDLCTGFLGAMDLGTSGTRSYQFNVPANSSFVVVVETLYGGDTCASYTISVVGAGITCATGGTPTIVATGTATRTATSTAIPATPTRTATSAATTAVPTMTTTRTATSATTTTAVPTSTRTVTTVTTATGTATSGTPVATNTPCTGWVTICHRTGNGNSHTITVSCSALPAHIAHGDTMGACPQPTPRALPNRFSDVNPGDFFFPFVLDLNDDGSLGGYSDGTFRPYNNATRGQFVKIAVLAFHIPLYTGSEQQFSDVPPSHTFYQYIETARRDNIVGGYSDGTFRPFADVTRGQVAKIAVESARMQDLSTNTPSFSDVPTNHTFYSYIETAYANGILSGYSDGTFRPNNDATRGQVAKIVDLATHPGTTR